jgi:hypothetical protein
VQQRRVVGSANQVTPVGAPHRALDADALRDRARTRVEAACDNADANAGRDRRSKGTHVRLVGPPMAVEERPVEVDGQ